MTGSVPLCPLMFSCFRPVPSIEVEFDMMIDIETVQFCAKDHVTGCHGEIVESPVFCLKRS